MSGRFIQKGSEAGAQTPPLLRASSPLKPKNQPRTNIETGTTNGGTSQPIREPPGTTIACNLAYAARRT